MTRRNFRTFVSGNAEVSLLNRNSSVDPASFYPRNIDQSTGNSDIDTLLMSIIDRIKNLDHEIESIKHNVEGQSTPPSFLFNCDMLDISGGGVKLKSTQPFNMNEVVFIRLNIYNNPNALFESFGRVIRSDSIPSDNGHKHYTAIKFINLDEDKREKLISYTFNQQRKYIRAFNTVNNEDESSELNAESGFWRQ